MSYEIHFLEKYDRESVIAELRRIAGVTGRQTVKVSDLDAVGRVSLQTVVRRFGSMRGANEAAGLTPSPVRKRSDEELLKIVRDLWNRTAKDGKRYPLQTDLREYGFPVSACTISSRFGSWKRALVAANDPEKWKADRATKRGASRSSISIRTRFLVFKRDLYQCRICRKKGVELEVDHVIPVALGGSAEMDNLQTLCVPCNRGKRDSLQ